MRGTFITPEGRFAFYGKREDKPDLEHDHTFLKGVSPPNTAEQYSFRDYVWDGEGWGVKPEATVQLFHLKASAKKRIEAEYPLWKQASLLMDGGPDLAKAKNRIKKIRDRCDELEQRTVQGDVIDWEDDLLWP